MKFLRPAAMCAIILAIAACTRAQTLASWQPATSGNWTDPTKWSINPLYPNNGTPSGSTYNAEIAATGGSYTVTLNSPITLNQLTLNSPVATLAHTAGTLTLAGPSYVNAGSYLLGTATLRNNGPLSVSGLFRLAGGSITGTGSMTVLEGGEFRVGSGDSWLGQNLRNFGTVTLPNEARLYAATTATTITNSHYVNVVSNSSIFTSPFITRGLLSNAGTVTVAAMGAGPIGVGTFDIQNSGTILAQAGTTYLHSTTHTGNAYIGGSGTINLNGGTQTVNGTLTIDCSRANLELATVTGPGTVIVKQSLNWASGTMSGTGNLLIEPGASLNIVGSASLARSTLNAGTLNLAGTLSLGTGTIQNTGFLTTSSSGSSLLTGIGTLRNSGTILSHAGTLTIGTTTVVHSGSAYIGGLSTVSLSVGTHVLEGNLTIGDNCVTLSRTRITGPGDLIIHGNVAASGTIEGTGGATIAPSATLQLPGSLALSRRLNNQGTILLSSSLALLYFDGGTLVNSAYIGIGSGGFKIYAPARPSLLVNEGTIAIAGVATLSLPSTTNSGSIIVNTGTASIYAGSMFNSGTLIVNGGEARFLGGQVTYDAATVTGAGRFTLLNDAGATHTLQGPLSVSCATTSFLAGKLTGPGDLLLSTQFSWGGGELDGDGSVEVAPGAAMTIIGNPQPRTLRRDLFNAGTVNFVFSSSTLTLVDATFSNTNIVNISTGSTTLVRTFFNSTGTNLVSNVGTMNLTVGPIQIDVPLDNTGTIAVNSAATLKMANTLTNTGTIDLHGALVVDYAGVSPIQSWADQIGTHILSTEPGRAIAYAEASDLGIATLGGVAVDSTSVLMKLTYPGDTNLDGQVDITDLAALATAWQTPGVWINGDFDYSGFIDITDLALLATNWQMGVNANAKPPTSSADFSQALASVGLGGVQVPEPQLLLFLMTIGVLQRRAQR